ncbi:MAG: DNA ligase D, partial [bacterium]
GIFFDCLALDGHDLRRLPLTQRKECLRLLVPPLGPVHYGDHVLEHGEAFYDAASAARLEGIVAKKIASPYAGARSRDWIKIKCLRAQEFVIGGYTDPQGSRGYLGALHLGLYDDERFVYVSKVGTGFDDALLKLIGERLEPLRRQTSPFDAGTPAGRAHHWVEPRLVCEVRFAEWTAEKGIRHPVFLGIRDDKKPEDCRFEDSVSSTPAPSEQVVDQGVAVREDDPGPTIADGGAQVKITNPGKVFWPQEGYTKSDLVGFYESVAPLLLPYLRDRPLVLTRYPDGIKGKSFFQKDAPDFVPAWVRTERIYSKDAERDINYFIVNDPRTLRYVANLGTIPLHFWSSHLGSLDRPDWLVLDLDPKGAPFADVIEVARLLHGILEKIRLPHYVKTSGATGLHILVPLGARYSYEEARNFARLLAMLGAEAAPKIATLARPIGSRGGKVYIDFGQNGHGRTIVAPYSIRPLPGAPVSCPLRWDEVTPRLDPGRFTIKTTAKRFEKMRDPLLPILTGSIDMAEAIVRLERRLQAAKTGRA